ncbi:MAG: hypothetical protein MI923_13265 [Phycisphaerales bacterium]|nr:hypothetical protein [Phycisphaerales bacterium]
MRDIEIHSALDETQYLLSRWQFTVSTRGFYWIQPVGATLSPEELAGFLTLFKRGCDGCFPSAVVFDFGSVNVVGEQWNLMFDLLEEFALAIDARCRITSYSGKPATAALIDRPAACPANEGHDAEVEDGKQWSVKRSAGSRSPSIPPTSFPTKLGP